MGAASASVALASCAINDYFDWRLDALNDATKPIPSGLIAPDRALLVAALLYICLLALTCMVPNVGGCGQAGCMRRRPAPAGRARAAPPPVGAALGPLHHSPRSTRACSPA